jgi:hypothetical protein
MNKHGSSQYLFELSSVFLQLITSNESDLITFGVIGTTNVRLFHAVMTPK